MTTAFPVKLCTTCLGTGKRRVDDASGMRSARCLRCKGSGIEPAEPLENPRDSASETP